MLKSAYLLHKCGLGDSDMSSTVVVICDRFHFRVYFEHESYLTGSKSNLSSTSCTASNIAVVADVANPICKFGLEADLTS